MARQKKKRQRRTDPRFLRQLENYSPRVSRTARMNAEGSFVAGLLAMLMARGRRKAA